MARCVVECVAASLFFRCRCRSVDAVAGGGNGAAAAEEPSLRDRFKVCTPRLLLLSSACAELDCSSSARPPSSAAAAPARVWRALPLTRCVSGFCVVLSRQKYDWTLKSPHALIYRRGFLLFFGLLISSYFGVTAACLSVTWPTALSTSPPLPPPLPPTAIVCHRRVEAFAHTRVACVCVGCEGEAAGGARVLWQSARPPARLATRPTSARRTFGPTRCALTATAWT